MLNTEIVRLIRTRGPGWRQAWGVLSLRLMERLQSIAPRVLRWPDDDTCDDFIQHQLAAYLERAEAGLLFDEEDEGTAADPLPHLCSWFYVRNKAIDFLRAYGVEAAGGDDDDEGLESGGPSHGKVEAVAPPPRPPVAARQVVRYLGVGLEIAATVLRSRPKRRRRKGDPEPRQREKPRRRLLNAKTLTTAAIELYPHLDWQRRRLAPVARLLEKAVRVSGGAGGGVTAQVKQVLTDLHARAAGRIWAEIREVSRRLAPGATAAERPSPSDARLLAAKLDKLHTELLLRPISALELAELLGSQQRNTADQYLSRYMKAVSNLLLATRKGQRLADELGLLQDLPPDEANGDEEGFDE